MRCPSCIEVELEQRPPWTNQWCPKCKGTWKTDYLFAYWTGFKAGFMSKSKSKGADYGSILVQ